MPGSEKVVTRNQKIVDEKQASTWLGFGFRFGFG